jgi:hypothetical protein
MPPSETPDAGEVVVVKIDGAQAVNGPPAENPEALALTLKKAAAKTTAALDPSLDPATVAGIETLRDHSDTQTFRFEPIADTDEEVSIDPAFEHSPFFRGLPKEAQTVLALHATPMTLGHTQLIRAKGLYISTGPEKAQFAVMDENTGEFANIIWEVGQGAHIGEFMLAFGSEPSAQLAVIGQPTPVLFIPADALEDLNPEEQNILKANAIRGARFLSKTNRDLLRDQIDVVEHGGDIEIPSYGGTEIPTWFTGHPNLKEVTYQPGQEIELKPGTQYILGEGSALVKDETGTRTLGRMTPGARMGEITTLSEEDTDKPTARIFAETTDTAVWEIPLQASGSPIYRMQLDDMGAALLSKLKGIAQHQSTLRDQAASS